MIISIIVALAKDLAIGKDNNLLCHIPGDLKRFKELTTGHTVVMGRRTLESLPGGNPLPNRRNLVLTSHPETLPEGCEGIRNIEDIFLKCDGEEEVFIIGGATVYTQALPLSDRLYLTQIDAEFPEADTFFPEIEQSDWEATFCERHASSEKCPYSFAFVNFQRK